MLKLDLLDVMTMTDFQGQLFVSLNGQEVPVVRVDSTPDKLVFFVEEDQGIPVFTELSEDEINAALSGDDD
jgi:hypothetical protein